MQVNQLVANFACGIDHGDPALAAAQFTVNGKPSSCPRPCSRCVRYALTLEGRDRVRARWEGRNNVVTRHVFSQFVTDPQGS